MLLRLTILLIAFLALVSLLFGRKTMLQIKGGLRARKVDKAAADLMNSGNDHEAFIAQIPDIAERHRKQINDSFGEKLGYQKSDLARLDAIIEKAWGKDLPANIDTLVLTFGAYFGETIRKLRGGQWDHDFEHGYCLRSVGGVATIYPFEKVKKRFQDSSHNDLALFYRALVKTIEKPA